ncbi:SWIM zinc finger family protein [Streptomyces sp. NRRL S-244]|uniref:SWIM zinc finger family protein n=1 Tax=Streptomyces sp. NRRL S-244 TaxID=1463897 RepID=UPI0004BF3ADA|nr:SWIM zinc finger family protein [Streptomyces sp. NRRL S-244]
MTEQGVRQTAEEVLALAPDDASRKAGAKLGGAGPWSQTGGSASGLVWGLCKGSGSTPYRTVVDLTGPAYSCSCPSRKSPCKHALGLLLLRAAEGFTETGETGGVPDWAAEWSAGRAAGRAAKAARPAAAPGRPADEEAAKRRAERRAARIGAGVTELEQRLEDVLRSGLAGQQQSGYAPWEETAARMVDAQAPGLAARVRELGTIPSCGPGWPARMLEEGALLHLLNRGWLGLAGLPEPLAATVRSRVGLPVSAAEGEVVRDRWLVLAQYDSVSPDGRLTTRRTWLIGLGSGRPALVLDFGPPGRPPELALPVGLAVEAEARFRPGTAGLRADLGERSAAAAPSRAPAGVGTGEALEAYGAALREDPWLDAWPVVLGPVIPVPGELGWQLADAEGTSALPVTPAGGGGSRSGLWQLAALSGGGPVTVFGECGHRGFTPLTAWHPGCPEPVALG